MPETAQNSPPVVFISYSQESVHREKVAGLAATLMRDGCDVRIDIAKISNEDWIMWMVNLPTRVRSAGRINVDRVNADGFVRFRFARTPVPVKSEP